MDVTELSDDELRSRLLAYGINVGPIGATTRSFYEKKLGKLIDSGGVQATKEDTEEEDEEDDEDEEVQINYRTAQRTYSSPPEKVQQSPMVQQSKKETIPDSYTPIIKARQLTADSRSKPDSRPVTRPSSKPAVKAGGGGGLGMWIKLLFIVIVAVLVYLVIINMNESAQAKIPVSHDGV